jgi:CBS domain-containing protein
MQVMDIMSENVFTVTRETPLKVVAERMLHYGISGMPVVDGDGRLVGVVSETDILFKERHLPHRRGVLDWLAHYGEDPPAAKLAARTAKDAMTTPAVTIAPGRSVADAASLMLDLGIDRLPVLSGEELVGIVTRADLVRAFVRTDEELEREIREEILLQTLWIDSRGLGISVRNGHVVLDGVLARRTEVDLVSAYVARVPGVVAVDCSRLGWRDDDLTRRGWQTTRRLA